MTDNENGDRKKITAFLEPDLHRAASVKLAQKGGKPAGFSFQSVVSELLADWVGGKREVQPPATQPGPDRYREDLERLVRVLENGSSEDRAALRSVLKSYDRPTQEPKGMPPNPSRSSRSSRDQHRPSR